MDRFKYGYDQAGNRIYRENTVAASAHDEFYGYDGLHRLTAMDRGDLNAGKTASAPRSESLKLCSETLRS